MRDDVDYHFAKLGAIYHFDEVKDLIKIHFEEKLKKFVPNHI